MKGLKAKYIKLTPETRLHQLPAPIIGLTGGIATGKSTVSKLLEQKGVPVIDADQLVKEVYKLEETKNFLSARCPEALAHNEVIFPTLRERFFKDPALKKDLEAFIYQRLPKAFHEAYARLGSPSYVVYDVPLLFEKGLDQLVDLRVLVYAPRKIQRARLMKRDGHLEEMAERILDQQMDIEAKRPGAEFIIDNSAGTEELAVEVDAFLRQVLD